MEREACVCDHGFERSDLCAEIIIIIIIMEMSRLTRDGTAESVSRDQILRHARGQGNIHFPCSADHEQDWQPYPVDPYSAICDDHTYIHTLVHCCIVDAYVTTVQSLTLPFDDAAGLCSLSRLWEDLRERWSQTAEAAPTRSLNLRERSNSTSVSLRTTNGVGNLPYRHAAK